LAATLKPGKVHTLGTMELPSDARELRLRVIAAPTGGSATMESLEFETVK
jgi:hypothetical protein